MKRKKTTRACREQEPIVRPSLNPQKVNDSVWYYERKGSIELIHEIKHDGRYIRTDTIRIPWRTLERSMRRCRPNKKHSGA